MKLDVRGRQYTVEDPFDLSSCFSSCEFNWKVQLTGLSEE